MAAETTTTSVTELIPPEQIGPELQRARQAPSLLGTIAWAVHQPGAASYTFPRLGPLSVPAGTKAEFPSANFSNVEVTSAEETVTPGVTGLVLAISRESQQDAVGIPKAALDSAYDAMIARAEADAFSVITAAEETFGSDSQTFDLAFLREAVYRYSLLRPAETPVLVCGPAQIKQLRDSISTSASSIWVRGERFEMLSAVPGFRGSLEGLPIFEAGAGQLPTNAGAECSFVTSIDLRNGGRGLSGIGFVSWVPVTVEIDPDPVGYADRFVFFARYGVTLTNNSDDGNANLLLLESAPESP